MMCGGGSAPPCCASAPHATHRGGAVPHGLVVGPHAFQLVHVQAPMHVADLI